jgi:hypothetical protein
MSTRAPALAEASVGLLYTQTCTAVLRRHKSLYFKGVALLAYSVLQKRQDRHEQVESGRSANLK